MRVLCGNGRGVPDEVENGIVAKAFAIVPQMSFVSLLSKGSSFLSP